ncbi:MAG: hypothetical protein ABW074_11460 [Sedimenticola sp.]
MMFEIAKEYIRSMPGKECFALDLDINTRVLVTYLLWFDNDDPDDACFTVNYERGRLFSSTVEKGCYMEAELPNEVRAQEFFPLEDNLRDLLVTGLESVEVLYALLPDIADPMLCVSDTERSMFASAANRQLGLIHNRMVDLAPFH